MRTEDYVILFNREKFFSGIRQHLFKSLSQEQVNNLNEFMSIAEEVKMIPEHLAYVLATTYHETDRTMRPIEEYGKGANKPYGKKIKFDRSPYVSPDKIYYGRGYVQLTWYENYAKAEKYFNVHGLLSNPELALDSTNAARIAILGMQKGIFTGKKLSDYIDTEKTDFVQARRIINVLDRADKIAGYAFEFLEHLVLQK